MVGPFMLRNILRTKSNAAAVSSLLGLNNYQHTGRNIVVSAFGLQNKIWNRYVTTENLNESIFTTPTRTISTIQCNDDRCILVKVSAPQNNANSMKIDRKFSNRREQQNKPERKLDYESDSDSDSDGEYNKNKCAKHGGRERGSSEFWRRKMRTIHGLLDINNDGVISFDDYDLLAQQFANLGHLTAEETEEFQKIMKKTWESQWGEPEPYNLITVEQYLTEMHHMLNDKDLSKKVHLFLPYLFKAVDKDNSGYISLTEFKIFFNCLGLTDEDAAVSFAVIDKNGDGKLSIKEFVKLGRDYFFAEDEKRISKMFWGPLVK